MKRFLFVIPIILLIILNACASGEVSAIAPSVGTAVGQTQTAAMWTPTITSTPDPNEAKIVDWLNEGLAGTDPLERSLDAVYQVRDVYFPAVAGNSGFFNFRVDVRCDCASGTQCCVPERMFVVTLLAMKSRADKILEQVPNNTSEVKVVCFDHGAQLAVMAALWSDVRGYLRDQINGTMLGSRVYRSTVP